MSNINTRYSPQSGAPGAIRGMGPPARRMRLGAAKIATGRGKIERAPAPAIRTGGFLQNRWGNI